MAQLTAGFETGVNGNTLSIADGGDATAFDFVNAVGTVAYDNTHVKNGTLAAKIIAGASGTGFGWTTAFGTQTVHYGRIYSWLSSAVNPTSNAFAHFVSGATRAARLDFQLVSGNIRIRLIDNPATGDLTGSVNVTRDTWVRIEWHVIHSATVGQIEVKLFNNPDSSTPDETITSPASWNTLASVNGAQFGSYSGASGITLWMDAVVANATSYPGPIVTASGTTRSLLGVGT